MFDDKVSALDRQNVIGVCIDCRICIFSVVSKRAAVPVRLYVFNGFSVQNYRSFSVCYNDFNVIVAVYVVACKFIDMACGSVTFQNEYNGSRFSFVYEYFTVIILGVCSVERIVNSADYKITVCIKRVFTVCFRCGISRLINNNRAAESVDDNRVISASALSKFKVIPYSFNSLESAFAERYAHLGKIIFAHKNQYAYAVYATVSVSFSRSVLSERCRTETV